MSFKIVGVCDDGYASSFSSDDVYYDASIRGDDNSMLHGDEDLPESPSSLDEIVAMGTDDTNFSMHKKKIHRRYSKLTIFGTIFILLGIVIIILCIVQPETFTFGRQRSRDPARNGDAAVPSPTPTLSLEMEAPTSTGQMTTAPTPIANLYPYSSLLERLEQYIPRSILTNPTTPQGRAYDWLNNLDDQALEYDDPSIVQRYILASLYFATGGGLTATSWERCGAVPNVEDQDTSISISRNPSTDKCITEGNVTVCAPEEAFVECQVDDASNHQSSKRWLSKVSECEWYGVSCNDDSVVTGISLPYNKLEGQLGNELQILSNLKTLQLAGNRLQGELPELELPALSYVNMNDNQFAGTIPSSWYRWENVQQFRIKRNMLNGTFALSEAKWSSLISLSLSENDNLELPPNEWDGLRAMPILQSLDLSHVQINATFPQALLELRDLRYLDLSACDLQGELPPSIGQLQDLEKLHLHDNSFTGLLPPTLFDLSDLQSIRLQHNDFSGSLPETIGRLSSLQILDLRRSGLSGEIPVALGELDYLESVHLEFNSFVGDVPRSLCEVPNRLSELVADCDKKGDVRCECCTQCCSSRPKEKCSDA